MRMLSTFALGSTLVALAPAHFVGSPTVMAGSGTLAAEPYSTVSPLKQGGNRELLNATGVLETNDPQLNDGSYFDVHTFEGQSGQIVTITLESADFDTFLILLDPNSNPQNTNDDANADSTNSAISQALPMDGVYSVVVTSYEPGAVGTYRLQVVTTGQQAAPTSGSFDDLIQQGTQNLRMRNYPVALQRFQQALQLAQQQGDRPNEARAYEYLAIAQANSGDFNNSLVNYERALALQQALGNRSAEMRILQNVGVFHEQMIRDPAAAREYYQRALQIAQELGDASAERDLRNRLQRL
jgi:tetratricopeptide (TPR) repeat protein